MDRQRKPARCDKGLRALIDETRFDQPVGDELLQVLHRAALHARGDFLGEEFEQKVGHMQLRLLVPHSLPSHCERSERRGGEKSRGILMNLRCVGHHPHHTGHPIA